VLLNLFFVVWNLRFVCCVVHLGPVWTTKFLQWLQTLRLPCALDDQFWGQGHNYFWPRHYCERMYGVVWCVVSCRGGAGVACVCVCVSSGHTYQERNERKLSNYIVSSKTRQLYHLRWTSSYMDCTHTAVPMHVTVFSFIVVPTHAEYLFTLSLIWTHKQ